LDLSNQSYLNDCLVIAGDSTLLIHPFHLFNVVIFGLRIAKGVSDRFYFYFLTSRLVTHEIDELESFFAEISKKFKAVAFVPGNHDLWLVKGDKSSRNSIEKFERILDLCSKYGIHTSAKCVEDEESGAKVWLVPLFSWYHEDFDSDESSKGERIRREVWCDFMNCKWPDKVLNEDSETPSAPLGTPEKYFLSLNEKSILDVLSSTVEATIISFSHFLPRRECFPPKESLSEYRSFMPKVIGSARLDLQIRSIGSHIHVFGHTHIPWNMVIDGVHYIQMCLMHPKERRDRPLEALNTIEEMCIFDHSIQKEHMYEMIEKRRNDRVSSMKMNEKGN
jgi:3',5'-cyclic AMP phosphodiesterase CpdA